MLKNYDKWFYQHLTAAEGGLTSKEGLPGDKGGQTAYGVARNYWPNWSGWKVVDDNWNNRNKLGKKGMFSLLEPHLKSFYKVNFWDVCKCDLIPEGIDVYLMTAAIHNGYIPACKLLQEAIGLSKASLDGKIGHNTLKALQAATDTPREHLHVLESLHELMKAKYDRDNSQYEASFMTRADRAYEFALSLIPR